MLGAPRTVSLLLLLVSACGGAQVSSKATLQVEASSDATETTGTPVSETRAGPTPAAGPIHEGNPETAALPEPPPRYPPELVREAIDRTAAAVDDRQRLGIRLAAVEQGPNAPWILAIVNRGTEPVRVLPDLRTLTLIVTPPVPEPDPAKKRKWVPKPKQRTCALPSDLVPREVDESLTVVLEPGEGLIDSFDPRLYCLPIDGVSPFVPGASVEVRLGWAEKVKLVYRKGKAEKVPLDQQRPPFVAERTTAPETVPAVSEAPSAKQADLPPTEQHAIKELLANPVELGSAYAARPPTESESDEPLRLLLTRGSDARTEREATLTVAIANRSNKPQRVYFRREFLTLEVSGPAGLIACAPGPDQRAPDRIVISTLGPGKRIQATSRLIELCPDGALRNTGLYLIHARYEPSLMADPGGSLPFMGRVVSTKPALVRVRKGWGDVVAQRAPERIRVGSAHAE